MGGAAVRRLWLVLVHRDDPAVEVGLVSVPDGYPGDALGALRVAYGVVVDGEADVTASLVALVERWRDLAPLHEAPGAVALFAPGGAQGWDLLPLRRPSAAPVPEHGSVSDRGPGGLATGGLQRVSEAGAVARVDAGSSRCYTEGADRARNGVPVASPGPEGDSSGPPCVWCGHPIGLVPGRRRGLRSDRETCSDRCRRARARARVRAFEKERAERLAGPTPEGR